MRCKWHDDTRSVHGRVFHWALGVPAIRGEVGRSSRRSECRRHGRAAMVEGAGIPMDDASTVAYCGSTRRRHPSIRADVHRGIRRMRYRETRHLKIRTNEISGTCNASPVIGRTNGKPRTCRLCGKMVRLLVNQTYGNAREHRKHRCPHGQECPTGMTGIIAQTLTPRCVECRVTLSSIARALEAADNMPTLALPPNFTILHP